VADKRPKIPQRRQVWGDGEDNFIMSLPPMARAAKKKRLVGWAVNLLRKQLARGVAQQANNKSGGNFEIDENVLSRVCRGASPLEEVVSTVRHSTADHTDRSVISSEISESALNAAASKQLRELVSKIADGYKDLNSFTNVSLLVLLMISFVTCFSNLSSHRQC